MADSDRTSIFSRVRRMTAEVGGATDAQLLDRFVANQDGAAFELLLWRHAALVFGVCRRVLLDVHDTEDAFQATFLALARHAGRIARRQAVAAWLHKVAHRTALTARAQRARRNAREKLPVASEPISSLPDAEACLENQELRCVLDEEIGRLPERFRAAVVLCYLDGKSVDEAARLLGCARGTVASRLARARQHLRARLIRRGLAMTAALATLTPTRAAPPLSLIPTLTAAALRLGGNSAAPDGLVSHRISALTDEVLRAMFLHKLRARIVLLIAFLGLLAGGGWIIGLQAHASRTGEPPASEEPSRPQAAVQKESARAPHPVTVSRPLRRQAAPFQDYTGRLEARRSVEVRPAVGGFIEKVCFKAGAEVKKGDVLFELSSRASRLALDRARAELELAMVKKKQRDAEVARAQNLKARGAIGRDELDAITERAAIGEAAVKTARIEMDRAELELDATKVRAPMSGRVGRPLVDLGALVFRGQDSATLLTTVTSLDPISLLFEMDELSFLRYQRLLRDKQVKGEGSSLRMALASEEGFPHEGTLESFEDRVSPQTGTVRVRGSFANPDRLLLPGMFARVRMTIGPPRAVLEIPREAVLIDQGKTYVLVVREANIAERRPVTLGSADNGMRIIERGLGAEDWVVIAGLGGVRPGDRVEPRKAAPPTQKAPAGNRGH